MAKTLYNFIDGLECPLCVLENTTSDVHIFKGVAYCSKHNVPLGEHVASDATNGVCPRCGQPLAYSVMELVFAVKPEQRFCRNCKRRVVIKAKPREVRFIEPLEVHGKMSYPC